MSRRGRRDGGTWQRNGDRANENSISQDGGGGDGSSSRGGRTMAQQNQYALTSPTRSFSGRGVRRGATWREANANGPPRRMEVSIPHKNLKVFACAVQCLMKIGKELFIETTADQLVLRTLNDAKSAFSAFYFKDSGGFFETFRCSTSRPTQEETGEVASFDFHGSVTGNSGGERREGDVEGEGGSVSCKVLVRAVHNILRTLKKVVRLVIYVEGEDDAHIEPQLVFEMYCEFGYRKVHRFSLQDCEIMHAVFEGKGASRLSCPPVQISQLLEHIHGTAEVAVGASHDVLTVRSYHHPLTGAAERAVLKTEMSISTVEFDTYRFCGADDEEVELVFSLKEIKALLHFTEATEAQTLEMLFREGGDPLLFQSHSKIFAAELIMATMEPKIIRKEPAAPPPPPAGRNETETTQATQDPDSNDADGAYEVDPSSSSQREKEAGGRQDPSHRWAGQRIRAGRAVNAAKDQWVGGHGEAPARERGNGRGDMVGVDQGEGEDLPRRHAAEDRGRGGHSGYSGPTMTLASQDQQHFENDPFGEGVKEGGRGLEHPIDNYESQRNNGRRQSPQPEVSSDRGGSSRRRSHRYDGDVGRMEHAANVDEGRHTRNNNNNNNNGKNNDSGYGGGGQIGDEMAGSWSTSALGQSHSGVSGNDTEEPQSEMPTQFPGLRAAYDSAGEEFDVRLHGVSRDGVHVAGSSSDGGRGMGVDRDRRGGGDEDGEGPVHGGKRRRKVVEEDEE